MNEGEPEPTIKPLRRVVITPKDIRILTGKSRSGAYQLYDEIMKATGRLNHQFITIIDFWKYTGIDLEIIYQVLPY